MAGPVLRVFLRDSSQNPRRLPCHPVANQKCAIPISRKSPQFPAEIRKSDFVFVVNDIVDKSPEAAESDPMGFAARYNGDIFDKNRNFSFVASDHGNIHILANTIVHELGHNFGGLNDLWRVQGVKSDQENIMLNGSYLIANNLPFRLRKDQWDTIRRANHPTVPYKEPQ